MYMKGRLCVPSCTFENLGFDPFEYLNSNNSIVHGFIYKNYAPTETQRMYFTLENAGRIDYFRKQIEDWKTGGKLSDGEYCYLMVSLIESVSDVSNTAGVYGAFLKKWDSRALKSIVFSRVDFRQECCRSIATFNAKIEEIIENVKCDILYLDPPYTQNQYGTQYHLLETLVLDDNPSVSKVTGSRSTESMRSDWSKEYIEVIMKRYGRPETFVCKKIAYKKYQNWKSQNQNKYFECLFYVSKREDSEVVYQCPLNYIGSKAKVVPQSLRYLPDNFDVFMDAFGGGFNVGINIGSDQVIYNDINHLVTNLIRSFREYDTYDHLLC